MMNADRMNEELRNKLMIYCIKITSSPDEAEDVVQESLIKIMTALEKDPSRDVTNAYLYKIAQNVWIDIQRKKRIQIVPISSEEHNLTFYDSSFQTRELLEVMAQRLSVKYMVVLLLMDVFRFTAKETAEVIHTTEGAVRITLNRARTKLKSYSHLDEIPEKTPPSLEDINTIIDSFARAFNEKDPKAIYSTYLQLNQQGISISSMKIKEGKYYFTLKDPDGNLLMITSG